MTDSQPLIDCPDCDGFGFLHYRFDEPCNTCQMQGKVRMTPDGTPYPRMEPLLLTLKYNYPQ